MRREQFLEFVGQLFLLQTGQAVQAHLEDFFRLRFGQAIARSRTNRIPRRASSGRDAPLPAAASNARTEPASQVSPNRRSRAICGVCEVRITSIMRSMLASATVRPSTICARSRALRSSKIVRRVTTSRRWRTNASSTSLQRQQARLAIDQRDHVDAERDLHLRLLEQVVQQHVGHRVLAHFDDDAHAVLVGLVAQTVGRNAFDDFFFVQVGDLLDQPRLVHLIRQLGDDDRFAPGAVDFDFGFRAHEDAAAAGAIRFENARRAVDDAAGREIRAGNVLHQHVQSDRRIVDQRHDRVDHFAQVVRRNIRRHADRDAGRTIDQQIRNARGQRAGFRFLLIVVRHEIDGVLVDVGEQIRGESLQAAFGVAHRRGGVAVDRTEVALPVDQRIAQREILRHAHERVVDGGVAVRMVFTHHVTDHARAFHVGAVPHVVGFLHAEQHAAMHRFQAVPHVRAGRGRRSRSWRNRDNSAAFRLRCLHE